MLPPTGASFSTSSCPLPLPLPLPLPCPGRRRGMYGRAWLHLSQANWLMRGSQDYTVDTDLRTAQGIQQLFRGEGGRGDHRTTRWTRTCTQHRAYSSHSGVRGAGGITGLQGGHGPAHSRGEGGRGDHRTTWWTRTCAQHGAYSSHSGVRGAAGRGWGGRGSAQGIQG